MEFTSVLMREGRASKFLPILPSHGGKRQSERVVSFGVHYKTCLLRTESGLFTQWNLGAFRNKANSVARPIRIDTIRKNLSNTRAALIHSFWFFSFSRKISVSSGNRSTVIVDKGCLAGLLLRREDPWRLDDFRLVLFSWLERLLFLRKPVYWDLFPVFLWQSWQFMTL